MNAGRDRGGVRPGGRRVAVVVVIRLAQGEVSASAGIGREHLDADRGSSRRALPPCPGILAAGESANATAPTASTPTPIATTARNERRRARRSAARSTSGSPAHELPRYQFADDPLHRWTDVIPRRIDDDMRARDRLGLCAHHLVHLDVASEMSAGSCRAPPHAQAPPHDLIVGPHLHDKQTRSCSLRDFVHGLTVGLLEVRRVEQAPGRRAAGGPPAARGLPRTDARSPFASTPVALQAPCAGRRSPAPPADSGPLSPERDAISRFPAGRSARPARAARLRRRRCPASSRV